ncbi:MAG: DMT family transporter [Armatimonadetes bacterium]|nr:DMT family transporter [Armatimonadota bacterium]
MSALAGTPWWVWAGGGLLGAFAVTAALIGIPRVSAGIVIGAQVFGQLLAAVMIDHFGWLGVPRVSLNPWRVAGAIGLFISAVLMQHK